MIFFFHYQVKRHPKSPGGAKYTSPGPAVYRAEARGSGSWQRPISADLNMPRRKPQRLWWPRRGLFIVAQANGLGFRGLHLRALKGHINSPLSVNPILSDVCEHVHMVVGATDDHVRAAAIPRNRCKIGMNT